MKERTKVVAGDMFYLQTAIFSSSDVKDGEEKIADFERLNQMDDEEFATVSSKELTAYNEVKKYLLIMQEYRKQKNLWWEDHNFSRPAYWQLREKRVYLIPQMYFVNLVNSVLKTDYELKDILSRRDELIQQVRLQMENGNPKANSSSDLSD